MKSAKKKSCKSSSSFWFSKRFGLENALSHHGVGDLLEAGDVGASDQVVAQAVTLGSLNGSIVDVLHDGFHLGVDFLSGPVDALSVLSHFELGDGNAAGVDSLGRSDGEVLLAHQEGQSIVGGGHVADFDVVRNTGLGDLLGPLHVDMVHSGD